MQRALIIGPKFHYFNASIARAFQALGFDTQVLAYDNPVHPYTYINKIRYKFASDKVAMKRRSRALFHLEAEAAFQQYQPDVVFVMNGDMLLPDTLLHWRGCFDGDPDPVAHPAQVALWFFDSFTHIPLCEEVIPAVDAVFCYEQTDIPQILSRYGIQAHFLPQAVDLELYHPIESGVQSSPKDYDIVFAGDLFHSAKRRQTICKVVARYPQSRIRVWGEYKPWYKNPWRWITRERRDIFMNRNTTGQQLNADYNRSRIVLNIHIEQQKDGANPKVYEIAASGAYQICDANPYVEQLFPHGEVGLYHNDEELFALIDEALAHDMSPKAAAAHSIVTEHHTFEARIREVLSMLYNI